MPVQIQEVGGERILVKFSHKFNVLKNVNISLPLQLTSIRNADQDPRDFNHADQCRSGSTSLIFSRKNCCPKLTKLNLFAGKRPLATRLAFDESMNETGAAPKQPRLAPDPFHSLAGQTFSTIRSWFKISAILPTGTEFPVCLDRYKISVFLVMLKIEIEKNRFIGTGTL